MAHDVGVRQRGSTTSHVLAARFTNGDEAKLMEQVRVQQAMIAIENGNLVGLRHFLEGDGWCIDQVN